MIFSESFVTLPPNLRGRDLFVGDLEGQWKLLKRMLDLTAFDVSRDRLIAVGHVIGAHPDSCRLLQLLVDEPWFVSVRGCHEHCMVVAAEDPEVAEEWKALDFPWATELPSEALEIMRKVAVGMPAALEVPQIDGRRVGVVHSEVVMGATWSDVQRAVLTKEDAAWFYPGTVEQCLLAGYRRVCAAVSATTGEDPSSIHPAERARLTEALSPVLGIDMVVCGHIFVGWKLIRTESAIWLNTAAAAPKGRLTAVDLVNGHYWQVGHRREATRVIRHIPQGLPDPLSWMYYQLQPGEVVDSARIEARRMKFRKRLLRGIRNQQS